MYDIEVSIIMGIYNYEDYLKKFIETILSQTYNNWELIMCDNGSTYNIDKRYRDMFKDKIILLSNETNKYIK